eukprot:4870398-Heterocapsa_arctica.AAC.1
MDKLKFCRVLMDENDYIYASTTEGKEMDVLCRSEPSRTRPPARRRLRWQPDRLCDARRRSWRASRRWRACRRGLPLAKRPGAGRAPERKWGFLLASRPEGASYAPIIGPRRRGQPRRVLPNGPTRS